MLAVWQRIEAVARNLADWLTVDFDDNRTVAHAELRFRHSELFLGKPEEDVARFGARVAQRRAAVLDRLAARGLAFVRRPAGVARDHGQLEHVEPADGAPSPVLFRHSFKNPTLRLLS